MATLNIVRSKPDKDVEKLIESFCSSENTTVRLYEGKVDWAWLVEQIFLHDKVVSWW
jgi:hypothetical protein